MSPTPPPPRLSPNVCAKIFLGAYGLSKYLPVFLLGTETSWGGGWMAILVVVCGKICGKMCGKIKKLSKKSKK